MDMTTGADSALSSPVEKSTYDNVRYLTRASASSITKSSWYFWSYGFGSNWNEGASESVFETRKIKKISFLRRRDFLASSIANLISEEPRVKLSLSPSLAFTSIW